MGHYIIINPHSAIHHSCFCLAAWNWSICFLPPGLHKAIIRRVWWSVFVCRIFWDGAHFSAMVFGDGAENVKKLVSFHVILWSVDVHLPDVAVATILRWFDTLWRYRNWLVWTHFNLVNWHLFEQILKSSQAPLLDGFQAAGVEIIRPSWLTIVFFCFCLVL